MPRLPFPGLVLAVLAALLPLPPARAARPPGVVVAHSPAASRVYLGSPAIALLPDGGYVVSHDLFGPGTTSDVTRVLGSRDRGVTWQPLAEVKGAFWSSLFVHRGALYLLGTSRQDGDLVIRRSRDGGRTWTRPADGSSGLLRSDARYHGAPVPVVVHAGRVWRGFEDTMGPRGWGSSFRALVISAPEEADLLSATNWTASAPLGRDPSWLGGKFGGWLEGNVVVAPDGGLANLMRADVREQPERAALLRVSPDGRELAFDPASGFVLFPGGCKKFTVRRDPRDGAYWSLANEVLPADAGGNAERTRNTLSLLRSADLRRWESRRVVLHHDDPSRHGFQYADWQFDGDDLVALVRTAADDDAGGAHSQHDSNYITFHRVARFRDPR